MNKETVTLKNVRVKPAPIARSVEDLFITGRYQTWKKGETTNPRWLRKENGFDFIALTTEKDMLDFEKYLACDDPRLHVEHYNTYTTGRDKNSHPMIVLNEMDVTGDTTKRAIIVINSEDLALRAMELIEHFCKVAP